MSDCEHRSTKCMKCMRYLTGDPETPVVPTVITEDPNGYYPATFTPTALVEKSSLERFHIVKGPLMIEIDFHDEGVIIGVWDSTDEDSDILGSCTCEYVDCAEPKHPTLLKNPNQFIIFDEASEMPDKAWDAPPMTDEEIEACGNSEYESTQIPVR